MDPRSAERTYHNEYLIDRGATWEMVEARLAEEVRFCSAHFFCFLPLPLLVLEHQPPAPHGQWWRPTRGRGASLPSCAVSIRSVVRLSCRKHKAMP